MPTSPDISKFLNVPRNVPRNVGILCVIQSCSMLVYTSYFGAIAISTWLNVSWLEHWYFWWTPITDLLRQVVPAFDNVERELVTKGFAQRVVVVHHLMTIGWLLFFSFFGPSIVVMWKMSRSDWEWIAAIWPKGKFIEVAGPLFFIVALYSMLFVLPGYLSENPLFAVHKYNIALFGLASSFAFSQLTGVSTVICLVRWLLQREAGSRANLR